MRHSQDLLSGVSKCGVIAWEALLPESQADKQKVRLTNREAGSWLSTAHLNQIRGKNQSINCINQFMQHYCCINGTVILSLNN